MIVPMPDFGSFTKIYCKSNDLIIRKLNDDINPDLIELIYEANIPHSKSFYIFDSLNPYEPPYSAWFFVENIRCNNLIVINVDHTESNFNIIGTIIVCEESLEILVKKINNINNLKVFW